MTNTWQHKWLWQARGFFLGEDTQGQSKEEKCMTKAISGENFLWMLFASLYIYVTHIIPYHTISSIDILCHCTK